MNQPHPTRGPGALRRATSGSDLVPRLVTALVLGPILVLIALIGPNFLVWAVVVAAAVIGNLELSRMTTAPENPRAVRVTSAVATGMLISLGYWLPGLPALLAGLAGGLLAIMVAKLLTVRDVRRAAAHLGGSTMAFVYCATLFGALLVPAISPDGPFTVAPHQAGWFLFPMFVVWMGDTGAYFAGRAFGRHKLAPLVSPGKTWEGAAGGLAASIFGGFLCWFLLLDGAGLSAWHVLLFAIPGAILGQIGDLCESLIKRATGFKDSGTILRGHGGMLDRVDGLLFAAPWFALLKLSLPLA